MKKFYLIVLFLLQCCSQRPVYAQVDWFDFWETKHPGYYTPVTVIDTNSHSAFGNGWIIFDGEDDFMRSRDSPYTEYIYNSTATFINGIKVSYGLPHKACYTWGHWDGTDGGWVWSFNEIQANVTAFRLGDTWYRADTLSATDSTFHKYEARFNKAAQTLDFYVDDVLNASYSSVTYTSPNITTALTLGNGSSLASTADPTTGELSELLYLKGKVDSAWSYKTPGGADSSDGWGFNEGAGTWAYGRNTFTISDRIMVESQDNSQGNAFCNGWVAALDPQDAAWSQGYRLSICNVSNIGTGVRQWASPTAFIQAFINGGGPWLSGWVVTAGFNTINVDNDIFSYNGDTAKHITYNDGSTYSKIGSNGSFFTGTVTQFYSQNDTGWAIGEYEDAGGNGLIDNIARVLPGGEWLAADSGLDGAGYCATSWQGQIVVGGAFNATGDGNTIITSSVATFNGVIWSAIGISDIGEIWALEPHNNELYAATSLGIYKLDGADWVLLSDMGGAVIFTLKSFRGQLWYAGTGGQLGYYNGSFHQMGVVEGFVRHGIQFIIVGQDLYILGSFYRIIYNGRSTVVNKLARWNGREWSAVNSGANMRPEDAIVMTYPDSTCLIYVGDQDAVDGIAVNYVSSINLSKSLVDESYPVLDHTPLSDIAEFNFPLAVSATAYKENQTGIDSVWVSWKIGVNGDYQTYKFTNNYGGSFTGLINQDTSETITGDTVYYTVNTVDYNHRTTSTTEYTFRILANPTDYRTNLVVLWEADSNVTVVGDKVSVWTNIMDTLAARQSTDATRPTLIPNFLNGHSVIHFEDKLLTFTSTAYPTYTVIIVYKATAFTVADADVIMGGVTGDIFSGIRVLGGGYGVGNGAVFRYPAYNAADTEWGIRVFQSTKLYNNGVEATYSATGTPGTITLSGIGRRPPVSYPFDGYIAAIRIYSEAVSVSNLGIVNNLYNNRFAIY